MEDSRLHFKNTINVFIQQGKNYIYIILYKILNCKVKSIVARDVLYILHVEMRVGRENGLVRANVVSSNPVCPSRVGRSTLNVLSSQI